jgi:hypothetical protein
MDDDAAVAAPDTENTPPPTPSADASGADDAAAASDSGDQASAEAQSPEPGAQPAVPPNVPASSSSQPAATLTPAPNVVRPRRGGIAGVMDDIADSLAGPGSVHTDNQGNEYINRKGQWLKIAGEALRGAAAGAAVAQGPGGAWRGAAAGIKAGDEMAEQEQKQQAQQTQEQRQAQQDKFNAIKLKHDMAAKDFELSRMQVKANQDDIKFSQEQIDREQKLGSADLGVYKDEAELAKVKEQHPDFWKSVYQNNIVAIPEIGPDGKRAGIHVFLRTPGTGSQLADPGTPIKIFTPGKTPDAEPTLTDQVPTVPMTHDMVDAYNNAAQNKYKQWHVDNNAEAYKQQQTQTSEAEEEAHRATAGKENAEAGKIRKETGNLPNPASTAAAAAGKTGEEYLATLPNDQAALVRDIGTGKAAPERIAYLLGRGQSKGSEQVMAQVAAAYPDLDTSKLAAYPKTYQDYTSGKTATALNSGATVLQHLDKLQGLNTVESHIPHTPDYTAYKNQVDTLAPELAKFYGHSTDADIKSYKDTLMSQLPGNRKAAIDTQAASMGKKLDNYEQQWRNAAPSAAYEAPMPGMSDAAKLARGRLDPEYGAKLFSVGRWQKANPGGDAKAAQAAAKQRGLEVIQ